MPRHWPGGGSNEPASIDLLVAGVRSAKGTRHVRDACLRVHCHVLYCETTSELLRTVSANAPYAIAVIEFDSDCRDRTLALLQTLKARFPHSATIVLATTHLTRLEDAFRIAQLGASFFVDVSDPDHVGSLMQAVTAAQIRTGVSAILAHIHHDLPAPVSRFIRYALARGRCHTTVDEIAVAAGLERRTLLRQLRKLNFPSPAVLLNWGIILRIAHLLENRDRGIESLASGLGFTSGSAIHNLIKRRLGLTVMDLRRAGPLNYAASAFEKLLSKGTGG